MGRTRIYFLLRRLYARGLRQEGGSGKRTVPKSADLQLVGWRTKKATVRKTTSEGRFKVVALEAASDRNKPAGRSSRGKAEGKWKSMR